MKVFFFEGILANGERIADFRSGQIAGGWFGRIALTTV